MGTFLILVACVLGFLVLFGTDGITALVKIVAAIFTFAAFLGDAERRLESLAIAILAPLIRGDGQPSAHAPGAPLKTIDAGRSNFQPRL